MMKPKIIILFVVLLVIAMFFIKRENLEGDSNVVTERTMTESSIKGPAGKIMNPGILGGGPGTGTLKGGPGGFGQFGPRICDNQKLFCADQEGLQFTRNFRSQTGNLGAKCMSTIKKICAPI
jgi:hypothetical protein